MGSVTNVTTTGDNAPEIFPVQYENHYMYCDNCGSFELKYWMGPDNYLQLKKYQTSANRVARVALIASLVLILPALLGLGILLVLSLLVYAGAKVTAGYFGSRITSLGLVCSQCQTRYSFGSAFFNFPAENPRGYTMKDVPLPLYRVYQIRGQTLDDA